MAALPQDLPADTSLTPPAIGASAPSWFRKTFLTRRFLFFSVLAHLLLGGVASFYVVQTINRKGKSTFAAASAPSAPAAANREHKVQMQKKQQTMSAPAQMKRVTTAAPNTKVALPQMPALPTLATSLSPNKIAGMSGNGTGLSMGGGSGPGGPGGGRPVSLFGLRTAGSGTLTGTFYDFKQTSTGQPTNMAIADEKSMSEAEKKPNEENFKFIGQFANANFSDGMVANFFKGPQPLYASQIFIPMIPADNGPKEFNLADKVKPRRWAVVYRGKVTPPVSGQYHFVGVADDYLIVRFRGKVVLDGSLFHPTGKKPPKEYFYAGLSGSLRCVAGDPVSVSAGDHYDIEILIGEHPGGQFCAFLLLEKDGVKYETDPKGGPVLPVFKVGPVETTRTGESVPATMPDQPWSTWTADNKP